MSGLVDKGTPPLAVQMQAQHLESLKAPPPTPAEVRPAPSVPSTVPVVPARLPEANKAPETTTARKPVKLVVGNTSLKMHVLGVSITEYAVTLLTDSEIELDFAIMTDVLIEVDGLKIQTFSGGGRFSFPERDLYGICLCRSDKKEPKV